MCWFAACATAAGSVWAGPLQERAIDRGASWVVHADLDRLRAGEIGRALLEHPDLGGELAAQFEESLGIDIHTQVHAITLYSTLDLTKNQGVALFEVDADVARELTTDLPGKGLARFTTLSDGAGVRYAWNLAGKRWHLATRKLPTLLPESGHEDGPDRARNAGHDAPQDSCVLVMSDEEPVFARALRVLDGLEPDLSACMSTRAPEPLLDEKLPENAPSHASLSWPLSDRAAFAGAGVVILARSSALQGLLDEHATGESGPSVVRSAEGLVMTLVERADDAGESWMMLHGTIRMKNAQRAESAQRRLMGFVKLMQGALALGAEVHAGMVTDEPPDNLSGIATQQDKDTDGDQGEEGSHPERCESVDPASAWRAVLATMQCEARELDVVIEAKAAASQFRAMVERGPLRRPQARANQDADSTPRPSKEPPSKDPQSKKPRK